MMCEKKYELSEDQLEEVSGGSYLPSTAAPINESHYAQYHIDNATYKITTPESVIANDNTLKKINRGE